MYTATSSYETVPALLIHLGKRYPLLKVDAREVFGSEVPALLRDGRCDIALAPMTTYASGICQRTLRREVVRLAVGESHPLAASAQVELLQPA